MLYDLRPGCRYLPIRLDIVLLESGVRAVGLGQSAIRRQPVNLPAESRSEWVVFRSPFDHSCAVGIEVKAAPLKRRPRTATLPELTVNWADPRLPTTPDKPGMLRNVASVLAPAAKGKEDVPITTPVPFQTVMETVTGTTLGLAMATAVV